MRAFVFVVLLAWISLASCVSVSKLLSDEWHLFKVKFKFGSLINCRVNTNWVFFLLPNRALIAKSTMNLKRNFG